MSELSWFYKLNCPVRDYPWGNTDPDGVIAGLLKSQGHNLAENEPRAELWMGAHPSAPSLLLDETPLNQAIAANPDHFLGERLRKLGVDTLPYLFKVLDAARPLSIQAHPDKALAEKLHSRDPEHYPDDNHKPELAISLGAMDALVGFRSLEEIAGFIRVYPELGRVCETVSEKPPASSDEAGRVAWLKDRYARLMRADSRLLAEQARELLERIGRGATAEEKLFIELTELYGADDPGIFCVFFLNLLRLDHAQGVYLGANEPHAYLGGPILECMAASDNVVRAGLTKKFCDVDTLVDMLHYRSGPTTIRTPRSSVGGLASYQTEAREFQVSRLELSPDSPLWLENLDRPSILITLKGEASLLKTSELQQENRNEPEEGPILAQGQVVLLPGDLKERNLIPGLRGSSDTQLYLASVHPDFFS